MKDGAGKIPMLGVSKVDIRYTHEYGSFPQLHLELGLVCEPKSKTRHLLDEPCFYIDYEQGYTVIKGRLDPDIVHSANVSQQFRDATKVDAKGKTETARSTPSISPSVSDSFSISPSEAQEEEL